MHMTDDMRNEQDTQSVEFRELLRQRGLQPEQCFVVAWNDVRKNRERLLLVTAEAEVYEIEVHAAHRRRFRQVAAAISGWQDRSLSWRELPEADLVQEALGFIEAPPAPVEYAHPCPCCGYLTLAVPMCYDICPVCWWEEGGDSLVNPRRDLGSPNDCSLVQAQANYIACGASSPRYAHAVRTPRESEPRDQGWRPIEERDLFPNEVWTGADPETWPADRLYWWRPTFWARAKAD